MTSIIALIRGFASSLVLACGFSSLATRLDPFRQSLKGSDTLRDYSPATTLCIVCNWKPTN